MDLALTTPHCVLLLVVVLAQALLLVDTHCLSRARLFRLNELADAEFFGARLALRLVESRERYVFAGHLANLVLSSFAGGLVLSFVTDSHGGCIPGRLVSYAGVVLTPEVARGVLFGLGAIVVASCSIAGAAIVKALLGAESERWISLQSPLLFVLLKPLCFVAVLSGSLARCVTRVAGLRDRDAADEPPVSAEELVELAEQSEEAGEIEPGEREMIRGVFGLADTVCREVMTPRVEVAAVPSRATLTEVKEEFKTSGCSRLLVYGEELDDVRGVLIFKDLLPFVGENGGDFSLNALVRPPFVVRDTAMVSGVLRQLCLSGNHLAVVIDEHGGFAGVVTVEDLVEEIIGDISDEFDRQEVIERLSATVGDTLTLDGSTLVADLNEVHGLELPDGEYDTVAGLLLNQLGRLPRVGDTVTVGGVSLSVLEMDQNRVARVSVVRSR